MNNILISEKLKEEGNEFLRKDQLENACESYSKAIKLNPENPILYCNRALVFLKTNQYIEAIEDCSKAIKLKKDYIKAYDRRAKSYMELKDYASAVKDFIVVVGAEPDESAAYRELKKCESMIVNARIAERLKKTGKIDEPLALADKEDILKEDSESYTVSCLQKIAKTTYEASEITNHGDYDRALKKHYENVECFLSLIQNSNKILLKQKANTYMQIGICFIKKFEFSNAVQILSKAAEIEHSDSELLANLYYYRGTAYGLMEEYPKAIEDLEKALKLNGKKEKIMFSLANLNFFVQMKNGDAIKDKDCERFLKEMEDFKAKGKKACKDNVVPLADLCFSKGIEKIYNRFCSKSVLHEPDVLRILIKMLKKRGYTLERQNKYDFAMLDYIEIIKFDKYNLKALLKVVNLYKRHENLSSAAIVFRKIAKIDPSNELVKEFLSKIKDETSENLENTIDQQDTHTDSYNKNSGEKTIEEKYKEDESILNNDNSIKIQEIPSEINANVDEETSKHMLKNENSKEIQEILLETTKIDEETNKDAILNENPIKHQEIITEVDEETSKNMLKKENSIKIHEKSVEIAKKIEGNTLNPKNVQDIIAHLNLCKNKKSEYYEYIKVRN